ncbi:MAG: hypothetical protein ABI629_24315 [bacterium]
MPVKDFHAVADPTAHENFMRWCREVAGGLFIHHGPQGAMLHRTSCPQIASWKSDDVGANRKVCSEDEQELLDHHLREHGSHPGKCPDCY